MSHRLLFVLACLIDATLPQQQWQDPHDMDFKRIEVATAELLNVDVKLSSKPEGASGVKTRCDADLYLKRLVSSLMHAVQLDEDEKYTGSFNVKLDKDDYDFLQEFVKSRPSSNLGDSQQIETLRKVNLIMDYAVDRRTYYEEATFDSVLSVSELLLETLSNPNLYFSVLAAFFLYRIALNEFTFRSILKYCFIYFYIIDCVLTYDYLIRQEEVQKMIDVKTYGALPPECDIRNMSAVSYVKFIFKTWFDESDCAKYYKATHKDIVSKVGPFKVLSYQLGVSIIEPCTHMGSAIGGFSAALSKSLPWYLQLLILPIILIVAFMACITLAFIYESRIDISLLHLFAVKFDGQRRRQYVVERLGEPPRVPSEREYVENVSSPPAIVERRNVEKGAGDCEGRRENLDKMDYDNAGNRAADDEVFSTTEDTQNMTIDYEDLK